MFSRIKNFLSRHKRKFIFTGAIVGGTIFMVRYAQRRLRDWQESEAKEFLNRTRQQQHFESTERTCSLTVISLAPNLKDVIVRLLDSDAITLQLREKPMNRVELWEDLKLVAFTRAAALVYGGTLMVVMLRVQLNLIGGYMFADSVKNLDLNFTSPLAVTAKPRVSANLQQQYLSLCHYFLESGIRDLCSVLEKCVRNVVAGISLKQQLTLQDLEQLFWSLQMSVGQNAEDPVRNMPKYLLSSAEQLASSNKKDVDQRLFRRMVTETTDLLESEEIVSIVSSCISQGFAHLVDRIAEYFAVPIPDESLQDVKNDLVKRNLEYESVADVINAETKTNRTIDSEHSELWVETVNKVKNGDRNQTFIHPNKVSVPMAKLIPIVNGLIHKGKGDLPDPWIQQLTLMEKLKVLGANIYEAFSQQDCIVEV